MIRPNDFEIEVGTGELGTFVRVTHRPTQRVLVVDDIGTESAARVRDRLVATLKADVFQPNDFRIDLGCSIQGDFVRVVHRPTGISQSGLTREVSSEDLIDAILEQLHRPPVNPDQL